MGTLSIKEHLYECKMKYDKLVRDNIPNIIKKNGDEFKIHIADDKEYSEKLKEKLQEEVDEFIKEPNAEELADILEVVYALSESLKITKVELERIRKDKANENGPFKKRIILDETS